MNLFSAKHNMMILQQLSMECRVILHRLEDLNFVSNKTQYEENDVFYENSIKYGEVEKFELRLKYEKDIPKRIDLENDNRFDIKEDIDKYLKIKNGRLKTENDFLKNDDDDNDIIRLDAEIALDEYVEIENDVRLKIQNDFSKNKLVENSSIELESDKDVSLYFNHDVTIKTEPCDEDYYRTSIQNYSDGDKNTKCPIKYEDDELLRDVDARIINSSQKSGNFGDNIIFEDEVNSIKSEKNMEIQNKVESKELTSVHYDSLMNPGEYKCNKCHKIYENR